MLTEEDVRWNRFVDEVCSKDIRELSGRMRQAALCFWYDAEVGNGGHGQYFDSFGMENIDEVIEAVREIGGTEMADLLRKAAEEGEKDDWAGADEVYGTLSPSMAERLQRYVERCLGGMP